jgi:beta-lactamase class D
MELFDSRFPGSKGAAVLFDGTKPTLINARNAMQPLTPCSTFKLYLALMGLESGVIRSASEVWKYNGEKRGQVEGRRDMSLTVAMRESSEWYYREVARRLGAERLRAGVEKLGYGQGWKGTKPEDSWIDGSLRISPLEQAQLVWKLEQEALPFEKRHQQVVKECLKVSGLELWGKTGSSGKDKDGLSMGWYVGAYRKNGKPVAFAVLQHTPDAFGPGVRKEMARRLR